MMPRLPGQVTEVNLSIMYLKLYMESVLLILYRSYALHCVSEEIHCKQELLSFCSAMER